MKYNPFADKDALIDYGVRGRDIVIPTTPRPPRIRNPGPPPCHVVTGGGIYFLMDKTSTYAQGVHALREACVTEGNPVHPKYRSPSGELYRQLTFKEDLKARLEDFNRLKNSDGSDRTLDDRLILFSRWNDSCTGVAYQKRTGKFKIIPVCGELITIGRDFNAGAISIDYKLVQGVELDRASGKYNTSLTKHEIENHEAWRAAVEGDVALLKAYRDVVFAAYKEKFGSDLAKGMGFYLRDSPDNELRALFVNILDDDSYANGSSYLYDGGFICPGSPVAPKISIGNEGCMDFVQ